ncbi:uncharacterized protein BCR38DRAFT_433444 [Pseudomassariella vexata]|uniref:Uncharacterized protein n=1 Tax=Pseudomassariella vexata TaxID=1141098 RepID=A0A1Y2DXB9_9PEZI|nr:uncharacterized protein BCR38DRAFT_433444 [Pseudomassariella vexata]ORY63913.1 hypothetical protein BCR38DRAFT_433444 [Pseudomassariella vexata]
MAQVRRNHRPIQSISTTSTSSNLSTGIRISRLHELDTGLVCSAVLNNRHHGKAFSSEAAAIPGWGLGHSVCCAVRAMSRILPISQCPGPRNRPLGPLGPKAESLNLLSTRSKRYVPCGSKACRSMAPIWKVTWSKVPGPTMTTNMFCRFTTMCPNTTTCAPCPIQQELCSSLP